MKFGMARAARKLTIAGCLLLTSILAVGQSGTNSNSQGVTQPVQVVNTPNVHVTNTPSVNVANTPSVTLAGGSSVTVTNPRDSGNDAIPLVVLQDGTQPYEDGCVIQFNGNAAGFCRFRAIPAGKRLVIQEVDFGGIVEAGLQVFTATVGSGFGDAGSHFLTATLMSDDGVHRTFATHQETHLHIGSNIQPFCDVQLTRTSNIGNWGCTLSGYLVNVQ
jgi:hypothetical protein